MNKSLLEHSNQAVSGPVAIPCDANLFLSATWRNAWWDIWGGKLGLHRCDIEHYSDSLEKRIALFGYTHTFQLLGLFSLKRFQPIGNFYPSDATILSEYADLISMAPYDLIKDSDIDSLMDLLDAHKWDDMVVPFCGESSRLLAYFTAQKARYRRVDIRKHGEGVCVDTTTGFERYLASLGKNTRLKLFNRRSLLAQIGPVRLQYAESVDDIVNLLDMLNEFDRKRWGRVCFGPESLAFHTRVASELLLEGKLKLSVLLVDEKPVSILYNLIMGDREFNVQAAYREDFHPKISLGTLHLGYAIERCFSDSHISYFDLLYGEGKNEFYKNRFNGFHTGFYTVHVLRSKKALALYWLKDIVRKGKHILLRHPV